MPRGENFDQPGFELTHTPLATRGHHSRADLFADGCSQPDDAAGESVFWSGGKPEVSLYCNFVQPDAAELVRKHGVRRFDY
jgi:hypothetical protein